MSGQNEELSNKELQELIDHYKELADTKLSNIHQVMEAQKETIRESMDNATKNNELNHSLLMRIYEEQRKTNNRVTELEIKTGEMEQDTNSLQASTSWARWLQRHPIVMAFLFVTAVWIGDLIPVDIVEKIVDLGSRIIKVFI